MPKYTTNITQDESFEARNINEAMRRVLEWNGIIVSKVKSDNK